MNIWLLHFIALEVVASKNVYCLFFQDICNDVCICIHIVFIIYLFLYNYNYYIDTCSVCVYPSKNLAIWLPISHWASPAFLESWTSPRYPPPTCTGKTVQLVRVFCSVIYSVYNIFIHIYIYTYISADLDREVQRVLSGRVLRLWKECQTYFGFNQVTYLQSSTEALCFGLTISTGPRHTLEVPTLAALRSRFHGAWGGVLESIYI